MNNERSLAKEITEGFEALKSMRNNEPVAWMRQDFDGEWVEVMPGKGTPFYTHPVKELTDEEILKMAADKFHYSEYRLVIEFARAILRKAQEK
jgi:hypothetical protein